MGVVYLEKILIDSLDQINKSVQASPVDSNITLCLGALARSDYQVITGDPSSLNFIITQDSIAKKYNLRQLVDTLLWFHDKEQLNHKNILVNIGNKPRGVPILDNNGRISKDALPPLENLTVIGYGDLSVPTQETVPGQPGAFYISRESGAIYAWEQNNVDWVLVANLKGAKGDKGDKGDPGVSGYIGATGPQGPQGNLIWAGTGVPNNSVGQDGDWYINKSTYELFGPKSGGFWPITTLMLKGTTGAQGVPGVAGAAGATGPAGASGNTVLSGYGAPVVSVGVNGDFYIDLTDYFFYGPKQNNAWGAGESIKSNIYIQSTQPTNPIENTIWFNTSNL